HLDTGYGQVTVDAPSAAAALEVMGRFAVDPRWLLWLPPTMAPCSTSSPAGPVEGYLEHPTLALADYRAVGVSTVVCEEKHMGSRAVVVVCREPVRRFGPDASGMVYTRTGRPFLTDPGLMSALVDRVRAAISAADLWSTLASDWLLLDTELLPWSAKAGELIRDQYASVGAAARAALPAALSIVEAGAARGLDAALPGRGQRPRA